MKTDKHKLVPQDLSDSVQRDSNTTLYLWLLFFGFFNFLSELSSAIILHHIFAFAPEKNVQPDHHQHGSHHTTSICIFKWSDLRVGFLLLFFIIRTCYIQEWIYLPRWSCSCKKGISIMPDIIWTRGLNAAVKTGPLFFTHHDMPT